MIWGVYVKLTLSLTKTPGIGDGPTTIGHRAPQAGRLPIIRVATSLTTTIHQSMIPGAFAPHPDKIKTRLTAKIIPRPKGSDAFFMSQPLELEPESAIMSVQGRAGTDRHVIMTSWRISPLDRIVLFLLFLLITQYRYPGIR